MSEPYRPKLHFTPPAHWMNDPNGFLFDGQLYHLYYQHNPFSRDWGPMHWGHAESPDLLHWTDHGIVMEPDALGTIFSGSGIPVPPGKVPFLPDGGLAFLFTQHKDGPLEQQSLAWSEDNGYTLIKYPDNPVIPNDIPTDFRDPKVFWYEPLSCWCMVLAGGPVRIYQSKDLVHWTMTQKLDSIQTECPDLFPLTCGSRTLWVLTTSGTSFYLGSFDGAAFIPESGPFPVDYGDRFYAAQSCAGTVGRTVWIGWMAGGSRAPTFPWRCAQSIPRELTLSETAEGPRLCQRPVRELDALRNNATRYVLVAGDEAICGNGFFTDCDLAFGAGEKPEAEFCVFCAGDACCRVRYDGDNVTVTREGLCPDDYAAPYRHKFICPLPWKPDGLTLRILADASVLEIFGPDGCTFSIDVYAPKLPEKPSMLTVFRGKAELTQYEL